MSLRTRYLALKDKENGADRFVSKGHDKMITRSDEEREMANIIKRILLSTWQGSMQRKGRDVDIVNSSSRRVVNSYVRRLPNLYGLTRISPDSAILSVISVQAVASFN